MRQRYLEKKGENTIDEQAKNGDGEPDLPLANFEKKHDQEHVDKAGNIKSHIKQKDNVKDASSCDNEKLQGLKSLEDVAKIIGNAFFSAFAHAPEAAKEVKGIKKRQNTNKGEGIDLRGAFELQCHIKKKYTDSVNYKYDGEIGTSHAQTSQQC